MKRYFCAALFLFANAFASQRQSISPNQALPESLYAPPENPYFFVSGSYLYWTAKMDGLSLAVDGVYQTAAASHPEGTIIYPSWKTISGFKAAAGIFLPADGLILLSEFTYYSNLSPKAKTTSFSSLTTEGLFNLNYINSLTSTWKNYFYRLDLGLSYMFFMGKYFTLKPFAGLSGVRFQETLIVQTPTSTASNIQNFNITQNRSGIGPIISNESNFFMFRNPKFYLSCFVNNGIGLLFSRETVLNQSLTGQTPQLTQIFYEDRFSSTTPMFESMIGLRSELIMPSKRHSFNFLLEVGFEMQTWLGFNNFPLPNIDQIVKGTYSLEGLTATARIGF